MKQILTMLFLLYLEKHPWLFKDILYTTFCANLKFVRLREILVFFNIHTVWDTMYSLIFKLVSHDSFQLIIYRSLTSCPYNNRFLNNIQVWSFHISYCILYNDKIIKHFRVTDVLWRNSRSYSVTNQNTSFGFKWRDHAGQN